MKVHCKCRILQLLLGARIARASSIIRRFPESALGQYKNLNQMDVSNSITYEITRTGNLLRELTKKRLRSLGVDMSPEEAVLMNQLWDSGDMALSELARWSVKEPSTLSRQVDSLVKKGYVTRRESPTDRRSQILSVSEKGMSVRKQFIKAELHLLDETLLKVSPEYRRIALAAIKKIRAAVMAELSEGRKR